MANLVQEVEPDEIYNLAAQSHVRVSFDLPVYTLMTVGMGALHVLEAARLLNQRKPVRVYQASSSEMFGQALETPQRETTPFNPQSPYACAKLYAHFQARNYRDSYGLFTSSGILFNHESPRRGETFVTRKITRAATRIKLGLQSKLYLGNLEARRDWGYARDYVESMWLMLQQDTPDDFVVATGRSTTIREFLDIVFSRLELAWQRHVETDPRYSRPPEVDRLAGDASQARQELGWQPHTSLEQLAELMVAHDLQLASHDCSRLIRLAKSSCTSTRDAIQLPRRPDRRPDTRTWRWNRPNRKRPANPCVHPRRRSFASRHDQLTPGLGL